MNPGAGAQGRGAYAMNQDDLYEGGLDVRRDVLGSEDTESSLSKADDFMTTFQHAVTELA